VNNLTVFSCLFYLLLVCSNMAYADENTIMMGAFSAGNMAGWEEVEFDGVTRYKLQTAQAGSGLLAESNNSASGWMLKRKVDIQTFPFLNWRWRTIKRLPPMQEHAKEGDDYVARIYVLVSDGWFFWQTKALNYVWSSQSDKDASWPNAYAPDNAKMISLRASVDKLDTWYEEKRNVLDDLKQWLGKDFQYVDAIAIMTDSDDSGLEASSMYGDIYFSRD